MYTLIKLLGNLVLLGNEEGLLGNVEGLLSN